MSQDPRNSGLYQINVFDAVGHPVRADAELDAWVPVCDATRRRHADVSELPVRRFSQPGKLAQESADRVLTARSWPARSLEA